MIELGLLILRFMEHATPDIEFWKLHTARMCSGDILLSKGHHLCRMKSSSSPCTVVVRFIGDKVALTILRSSYEIVDKVVRNNKVRLLQVQRGPRRHSVVTENLEYAWRVKFDTHGC